VSRSSPPLRPDPPVSSAPLTSPLRLIQEAVPDNLVWAANDTFPALVCAPSPRAVTSTPGGESGPFPALRPCSMAFPTKTVGRLLQCSRHRLPSGPFSRRFFRCSLCYGPRGCSPSWTDPTWRDIALRPPRTFLPELSRGRSPSPQVGYRYTAPGGGHRDRTFTGWSTAVTGCAF
jgi:hypothetical protein